MSYLCHYFLEKKSFLISSFEGGYGYRACKIFSFKINDLGSLWSKRIIITSLDSNLAPCSYTNILSNLFMTRYPVNSFFALSKVRFRSLIFLFLYSFSLYTKRFFELLGLVCVHHIKRIVVIKTKKIIKNLSMISPNCLGAF